MKKQIKIYIEQEDVKKLREKAEQSGFKGKGAVSHYIEKIAKVPIAFLDENVLSLLRSLKL